MSITGNVPKVKCINCGRVWDIEDLEIYTERHGFTEPPYEEWLVCPICYSDKLEDYKEDEG